MVKNKIFVTLKLNIFQILILGYILSHLHIFFTNYINHQVEQNIINKEKKILFDKNIFKNNFERFKIIEESHLKIETNEVYKPFCMEYDYFFKTHDLNKITTEENKYKKSYSNYSTNLINICKKYKIEVDTINKNNIGSVHYVIKNFKNFCGIVIKQNMNLKKSDYSGINDKILNNSIVYGKLILSFFILLIFVNTKFISNVVFVFLFFGYNNCCFCIRTGIYGGSFNPIHNGHIALAKQMLDAGLMDEVWFVVSPLNPFKKEQSDLLSDELRLEMTRLALEGETNMMAQDFEFHLPKPSYTWQTLQEMTKQYPNRQFILIMGADNWQVFHLWYNYQEILNNYSLVIYPREGVNIDIDSLPKNVKVLKMQLYPISSTQVRQYIKEGKSVDDLIPKRIIPKALKYYKGE